MSCAEKTVTTRKDHECVHCLKNIPSGSQAYFYSGKGPRYEEEIQVGIEYYNVWLHVDSKECGLNELEDNIK